MGNVHFQRGSFRVVFVRLEQLLYCEKSRLDQQRHERENRFQLPMLPRQPGQMGARDSEISTAMCPRRDRDGERSVCDRQFAESTECRPLPLALSAHGVIRIVLAALLLWVTLTPGTSCCPLAAVSCRDVDGKDGTTDEQRVHSAVAPFLPHTPWPAGTSTPIKVSVRAVLNQIIDVDERQQVLNTGVFLEQRWSHPRLSWTRLNMTSVKAIRMSEKSVWTPDTYIYHSANDAMSGFLTGMYVLINLNGDVQWPIRTQLKTFCPMDITMFPFDLQTCSITLGSWVHPGKQRIVYVNVARNGSDADTIDLSSYTDNSDWVLMSANMDEENGAIKLTLKLKRRSVFYIWILIVPFIMLTILSLMTFHMPSTSNEKLSLSLSVFMAYSMFMIMISERIPPATKHIPLIGIYLATIMTMTASSILVTVLIINIYQHKGFQRPSQRIREIFIKKLAPFFQVDYPDGLTTQDKLDRISELSKDSRSSFASRSRCLMPILIQVFNIGDSIGNSIGVKSRYKLGDRKIGSDCDLTTPKSDDEAFPKDEEILPTESIVSPDNNKKEWKLIAVVLDKLFFYVFIVIYLFIYTAIFLSPFIFKSF